MNHSFKKVKVRHGAALINSKVLQLPQEGHFHRLPTRKNAFCRTWQRSQPTGFVGERAQTVHLSSTTINYAAKGFFLPWTIHVKCLRLEEAVVVGGNDMMLELDGVALRSSS